MRPFFPLPWALPLSKAGWAKDFSHAQADDCGYYICQYEKQNIDATILEHARESRTVMFGEIHDSVMADALPPLADSRYVISLLGRLKAMGYGYLVLEVQTDAPQNSHSHDMLRCLQDYLDGKAIDPGGYPDDTPAGCDLVISRFVLERLRKVSLVIQMTNHCNAQCPQCCMRATADIQRTRLDPDEIRRILDAAGESGVQAVSFTGGEPFLFKQDLIRFIHYAGRAGIAYIRTGTNGFIFRHCERADFLDRVKVLADRLAATPLRNFWISLDSALPEVHEKMRGLSGVVKGIEKALPVFHAAGLFPSANLGLNRLVGGETTALLDPQTFASSKVYLTAFYNRFRNALERFYDLVLNLGFTMVNTCYPMSISEKEHCSGLSAVYAATTVDAVVRFSAAEKTVLYKTLLDTIPAYRDRLRIFSPLSSIYMLHRHYMETGGSAVAFGCRGGVDFFFIDANDGNTYPCGYRGHENLGKFWQLDVIYAPSQSTCDELIAKGIKGF